MPTCRNFDVYLHPTMNSIPIFFFLDIVKIFQTCYFEYFEKAWSWPPIMISPCRKLWCTKCWNQLAGNFDVYLHVKYQLRLNSFLIFCKGNANFLSWELWEAWSLTVEHSYQKPEYPFVVNFSAYLHATKQLN